MKKLLTLSSQNALLDEQTEITRVIAQTNQLNLMIQFYTKVLRLNLIQQTDHQVLLGTNTKVLVELNEMSALTSPNNYSSLYHFALLYPNELELAKALKYLDEIGYNHSPTDHGYSKTSYLTDPDGNTIELYIRTPDRSEYIQDGNTIYVKYQDGRIGNGRDPLDTDKLYALIPNNSVIEKVVPNDLSIGHVHIYASDIHESNDFYTKVLGFADGIMYEPFHMADVSLSLAKYHVIAFNEWKGNINKANQKLRAFSTIELKLNPIDLKPLLKRLDEYKVAYKETNDHYIFQDPSGIHINLLKK